MANNKFLEETGLSRLWAHTKKLVADSVTPQDNLLINSDFRSGIINQKGETSYSYSGTGGKLTVDMWISYGVNVGIEMNTIRIINRDTTEHTLRQKMSKAYPNQVYTVAVQVASVTGDVYINFNNETATNKKLKVGLNVFQITPISTFGEFCFLLKANAEIKFNYAKVEPGSFFTGMPLWNKTIELLKCQRYFINYTGTRITLKKFFDDQYQGILFPIEMNKKPLCTGTYDSIAVGFETTTKGISIVWATKTNKPDIIIINDLVIDAYDY